MSLAVSSLKPELPNNESHSCKTGFCDDEVSTIDHHNEFVEIKSSCREKTSLKVMKVSCVDNLTCSE